MKERGIIFGAPMVRAILEGQKVQTRRLVKPQPFIDSQGNFCWNGWVYGQDARGKPHVQALASPLPVSSTGRVRCPYGAPGDRLWVRETFAIENTSEYAGDPGIEPPMGPVRDNDWEIGGQLIPRYRASEPNTALMIAPSEDDEIGMRWTPSIHMPRWASRITLEVTAVRVERLHDISSADILAEGIRIPVCAESGNAMVDISTPNGSSAFLKREQYGDVDALLRAHWAALWCEINGRASWDANPWVWVVGFRRA